LPSTAENSQAGTTGLLSFLIKVLEHCSAAKIEVEKDGLPEGVQRLIALATAVPEKKDARQQGERPSFLARVGEDAIVFVKSEGELLTFRCAGWCTPAPPK